MCVYIYIGMCSCIIYLLLALRCIEYLPAQPELANQHQRHHACNADLVTFTGSCIGP